MKKIRISGEFGTIEGEDYIEIFGDDDMRIWWYEETSSQEDWEDFWQSSEDIIENMRAPVIPGRVISKCEIY